MINLTMCPEIVSDPTWKKYNITLPDKNDKQRTMEFDEPFFFSQSFTTSLLVKPGKTTVASGGMMNQAKDRMVYCFVNAQLVDLEGNQIADLSAFLNFLLPRHVNLICFGWYPKIQITDLTSRRSTE